jgi:hypothetical protein
VEKERNICLFLSFQPSVMGLLDELASSPYCFEFKYILLNDDRNFGMGTYSFIALIAPFKKKSAT